MLSGALSEKDQLTRWWVKAPTLLGYLTALGTRLIVQIANREASALFGENLPRMMLASATDFTKQNGGIISRREFFRVVERESDTSILDKVKSQATCFNNLLNPPGPNALWWCRNAGRHVEAKA